MADDPSSTGLLSACAELVQLGTATVSDALDRHGLPGSAAGIAPLVAGQRMAGPAFTVRYVPAGALPGTVGDYLDDCVAGQVVVLDNAGRTDCTVWGGILTEVASAKGLAGTVINGVCRDVARALDLSYPLYSRGRFMRTGKDRVEVAGVNEVITLGDVQVRPDDVVVGDDDGIVVVPGDRVAEILKAARSISAAETRITKAALEGMPLAEARARYGYHELQRGEPA
jgi:4-hydroxy-4-methyl-2-oxoglutarate aldolase